MRLHFFKLSLRVLNLFLLLLHRLDDAGACPARPLYEGVRDWFIARGLVRRGFADPTDRANNFRSAIFARVLTAVHRIG